MVDWRKRGGAGVVALGLGALLAGGSPVATAEPMLIVPGAGYAQIDPIIPNTPLFAGFYTHANDIGTGFYPNATPQVINYPASVTDPGTIGKHITEGTDNLDAAIKALTGPADIVGQSQGSMVLNEEQARLENDPTAPAADQLTFLLFADPLRGLLNTLFKNGKELTFTGLVSEPPVQSRYNTVVITMQYDLWSDTPDRPWNLLALANSLVAATTEHAWASFPPSIVPPQNISVTTNPLGATTTTYLVPATHLPLTEPLRLLGVPAKLVDALDAALLPAINEGYSRYDSPGTTTPYLSHGILVRGSDATPVAAVSTGAHQPSPGSSSSTTPASAVAPARHAVTQQNGVNPAAALKAVSRTEGAPLRSNRRP